MNSFKKIILLCALLNPIITYGRKFQFNFDIGQDTPDEGEERSGTATLLKLSLATSPSLFKFRAGFSY